MKKKILFTTPVLEHPAAGGPQLRIENSIKALNMISDLYVVSRVDQKKMGGIEAENFYKEFCKDFSYIPSVDPISQYSLIQKILFVGIKTFDRVLHLFGIYKKSLLKQYTEFLDAKFIINYANKYKIDIVWMGYGNISYNLIRLLKKNAPGLKIICDTDSVWSKFILRELAYETNIVFKNTIKKQGREKRLEEFDFLELSDVVTAVSQVDAQYYSNLALQEEKVKRFSNVIDEDSYSLDLHKEDSNYKKPYILLSGSFYSEKSPMAYAARWMLKDVWPILKESKQELYFYIVGNGANNLFNQIEDPRVIIKGKVPNLVSFFRNASVIVVPLWFESGTRFKILEGGICGVPIVSTSLGAEGLDVSHGENILIADDARAFAEAILKLLEDKAYANQLASNCQKLIREKYGLNALAKEGLEILKFLG